MASLKRPDNTDHVLAYEELSDTDIDKLSVAWAQIADALGVYQEVTGAQGLANMIYEDLWENIMFCKQEYEEENE